ncbi:Josephin-1 [Spiromyces aspiralis]|uniref:Josephin-1 n=1 Tax=Spiromyces aspiralis TaxID=68401 RepID=A0ACC1HGW1_9FUNG|nr:Josephin-1 [Spiromyces aspiralis]
MGGDADMPRGPPKEQLQHEAFTRNGLNRIADELESETTTIIAGDGDQAPPVLRWHPHRSLLRLGNWDVNVITSALDGLGYAVAWHDNRKPPESIEFGDVVGLIINIEQNRGLIERAHWFAVRQLPLDDRDSKYGSNPGDTSSPAAPELCADGGGGSDPCLFWNLDSKLDHPELIGDRKKLNEWLQFHIQVHSIHILIVRDPKQDGDGGNDVY